MSRHGRRKQSAYEDPFFFAKAEEGRRARRRDAEGKSDRKGRPRRPRYQDDFAWDDDELEEGKWKLSDSDDDSFEDDKDWDDDDDWDEDESDDEPDSEDSDYTPGRDDGYVDIRPEDDR